jgi:asparagine synthetase B (glutamine-hydrolysing)
MLEISRSTVSGRPVFYSRGSGGEYFAATHIKLLRQIGISIREDSDVLPELLVYRTIAAPRTLYRDIGQLPISGRISVRLEEHGCTPTINAGYAPPDDLLPNCNEREATTRVTECLCESIRSLQPASRSVATLLSGGLDSSILCRLAEDELGAYDTYSSSYPFEEADKDEENKYALSASLALSTRHVAFVPTSLDFLIGFVEALAIAEMPLHHLQSVLLHLLFKYAIPDHLDRILCGEGADSAWGSSLQRMLFRSEGLRQRVLCREPFYTGLRVVGRVWPKALDVSKDLNTIRCIGLPLSNPQFPVWTFDAYGDREWVKAHFRGSEEDLIRKRHEGLQWAAHRPLNDIIALYSLNYEVAYTTAVWSKLAEGQRKIVYYPFATKDLLDLAFSVPWDIKLRKPKQVLLKTGRRLGIPEVILNRPKRSFGIHSKRWAEKGGVLEPLIPVAAKVVDIDDLRSLQGTGLRPAMTLWSLLNYAILKRLFVLGEPVEALLNEIFENLQTRTVISQKLSAFSSRRDKVPSQR